MSKGPDSWMPLYIGDYLRDTMHLGAEQHGAYLMLIMAAWTRGGTLPDDDAQLAAIARTTPVRWRQIKPVIERFFEKTNQGWKQKRLTAELERAQTITKERSKAAAKRWRSNDANAMQTASPSQPQPPEDSPAALRASPPPLDEKADERPKRQPKRSGIPADWRPDEQDTAYAFEQLGWPLERIFAEGDRFRDHHRGRGNLFADHHAAWRTWVRKAPGFERGNGTSKHGLTPVESLYAGAALALADRERERARNRGETLDPAQPLLDRG